MFEGNGCSSAICVRRLRLSLDSNVPWSWLSGDKIAAHLDDNWPIAQGGPDFTLKNSTKFVYIQDHNSTITDHC